MSWRRHRLNPIQKRGIVIALALEVIVIVSYGAFSIASARPSTPNQASDGLGHTQCEHAASAPNPIVAENSCPGSSTWWPDLPLGSQDSIEAFPAPVSVNIGESVKLYVSTTAPSYQFRIYRMGWYHGLGGRLMYASPRMAGVVQPSPTIDPATRMFSASTWHSSATVPIPTNWVSGIYVVKLVSSMGFMRYTFFVVRNDASHAQVLFQSSVLTDQAYNTWGGLSLYQNLSLSNQGTGESGLSSQRSYAVSFDRPYITNDGLSNFIVYEFDLLAWLERQGYDVTYSTDVDTDLRPSLLLNHRLFLAAGHDEYWSTAMRQNVVKARDAGVSLAFFGANDMYWHVRLQPSPLGADRVVVCYKDATLDPMAAQDPTAATVRWRAAPLNQPEDTVLGEMYVGIAQGPAALVLAPGATPFLPKTNLHPGSILPGLAAQDTTSEADTVLVKERAPSNLTILAASPVFVPEGDSGTNFDATEMATLYTAPSGARVFDAGTYWWGLGLSNFHADPSLPAGNYSSADFQQFTANLLGRLLLRPGGKA